MKRMPTSRSKKAVIYCVIDTDKTVGFAGYMRKVNSAAGRGSMTDVASRRVARQRTAAQSCARPIVRWVEKPSLGANVDRDLIIQGGLRGRLCQATIPFMITMTALLTLNELQNRDAIA